MFNWELQPLYLDLAQPLSNRSSKRQTRDVYQCLPCVEILAFVVVEFGRETSQKGLFVFWVSAYTSACQPGAFCQRMLLLLGAQLRCTESSDESWHPGLSVEPGASCPETLQGPQAGTLPAAGEVGCKRAAQTTRVKEKLFTVALWQMNCITFSFTTHEATTRTQFGLCDTLCPHNNKHDIRPQDPGPPPTVHPTPLLLTVYNPSKLHKFLDLSLYNPPKGFGRRSLQEGLAQETLHSFIQRMKSRHTFLCLQ